MTNIDSDLIKLKEKNCTTHKICSNCCMWDESKSNVKNGKGQKLRI